MWGILLRLLAVAAVLLTVVWAGFKVQPGPQEPYPERTRDLDTVTVPAVLPEPVYHYFNTAAGPEVPRTETAVAWGRAQLKLPDAERGMWVPVRWKAEYVPGQAFVREMDVTWFGMKVLRAEDIYVDGRGSVIAAGRTLGAGPEVDQGANMTLWAEGIWFPSILLTDPRVRWEVVDSRTARLLFPFETEEDSMLCHFSPETGLLSEITALRYREPGGEREPWRIQFTEWREYQGIKVPSQLWVTWEEQGQPWAHFTVEGLEYNVDLSRPELKTQ